MARLTGLCCVLATLLAAAAARAQDEAEEARPRAGRLIRIPAPITSNVTTRAIRMANRFISQATKAEQQPVVIFEIEPGESSYGIAYDLAEKILSLSGAVTVAYVPHDKDGKAQTLNGHGVLAAIACQRIVMAADSKIGEAGKYDKTISPAVRGGYSHIAKSRGTVSEDLALGLLDPEMEVWEVRSAEGIELLSTETFEKRDKVESLTLIKPPVIRRGTAGLFPAERAKALGFVFDVVEDRLALAKVLGLRPDAVEEDPSLDGGWRPMVFPINGKLKSGETARILNKIIQQVNDENVNLLILSIDGAAGSLTEAVDMANYLSGLRPGKRRTVAFIPGQARDAAAVIALACDHVVMRPDSDLGGPIKLGGLEAESVIGTLKKIASDKGRSPSLAAAMVDPDLVVFRYRRKSDGILGYFSEADAKSQANPDNWTQEEPVTKRGETLFVDGDEAYRLNLASEVVDGFGELKSLYGLDEDPPTIEPDWVDMLVGALKNEMVLSGLLMIGFWACYAEFHNPGTGIGGFIAVCCFLLYFWANYLDGSATWLEILLFSVGLVLILLEIFVIPGFGICGLGGGMLMLISILMAMQSFAGLPSSPADMRELRSSLLVLTAAGVGGVIGAVALRRLLPSAPGFNQLVLAPEKGEARQTEFNEAVARYDHLIGSEGVAATQLTPSGKARFGDELVDVVTEGEVVPRGAKVIVTHTRGNRVVVRAA